MNSHPKGTQSKRSEISVEYVPLDQLKPYPNNPRINDEAVPKVMHSIQEFGFLVPLVITDDNVILTGHTRYKSALQLKYDPVPCIRASHLSQLQGREFRLVDNRTSEYAQWDMLTLKEEIGEIADEDMSRYFGFDQMLADLIDNDVPEDVKADDDTKYTAKVSLPIYSPRGTPPSLSSLTDLRFANELQDEIHKANIPEDVREFLILASFRHIRYDYTAIADYYASATPEVQNLMERSGLVIIDYDKAIEYGFSKLRKSLSEQALEEFEDENDEG